MLHGRQTQNNHLLTFNTFLLIKIYLLAFLPLLWNGASLSLHCYLKFITLKISETCTWSSQIEYGKASNRND